MGGIANIQRGLRLCQIGIGRGSGLRARQKRGKKKPSQTGRPFHAHPPKILWKLDNSGEPMR